MKNRVAPPLNPATKKSKHPPLWQRVEALEKQQLARQDATAVLEVREEASRAPNYLMMACAVIIAVGVVIIVRSIDRLADAQERTADALERMERRDSK